MNLLRNFILAITIFVSACGGSAGSNENPTNGSSVADVDSIVNIPVDDVLPVPTVQSTKELEANQFFDLSSSYELSVDIDISKKISESRAFLSICSDFEVLESGEIKIGYENCILRTSIKNGLYKGNLNVTNDNEKLIVAIWFFDSDEKPYIKIWGKNDENKLIIS